VSEPCHGFTSSVFMCFSPWTQYCRSCFHGAERRHGCPRCSRNLVRNISSRPVFEPVIVVSSSVRMRFPVLFLFPRSPTGDATIASTPLRENKPLNLRMYEHDTCLHTITSSKKRCVSSSQHVSRCRASFSPPVLASTSFAALSQYEVLGTFAATGSPFRVP
jgi:hypothetical protein